MSLLVLIPFVVLPAIGLLFALRTGIFVATSTRTTAQVVGYEEIRPLPGSEDTSSRFVPIVTFADERGKMQRVTLPDGRPDGAPSEGVDLIEIRYRRGDPRRARVADWKTLWLLPLLCVVPAVGITAFFAAVFAWDLVVRHVGAARVP